MPGPPGRGDFPPYCHSKSNRVIDVGDGWKLILARPYFNGRFLPTPAQLRKLETSGQAILAPGRPSTVRALTKSPNPCLDHEPNVRVSNRFPRSSPSPKARPFSHGSSRRDTVANTNAILLLGAALPRLPLILYIPLLVPLPLGSREVKWQIALSNGKDRDGSGCEPNLGRKFSDSHPSWMAVRYCPSLPRTILERSIPAIALMSNLPQRSAPKFRTIVLPKRCPMAYSRRSTQCWDCPALFLALPLHSCSDPGPTGIDLWS